MRWKSEINIINSGFTFALLILLSISIFSFYLYVTGLENEKQVEHTYQVLETSKELLSNLKDAETGQRGFIITGNEDFLEYFYVSVERNDHLLNKLKNLVSDNPIQQKRCDLVADLIKEKFAFTKEVIKVRREHGLDSAVVIINVGEGKMVMDKVRVIFQQLETEEQRLLSQRKSESNWIISFTKPVLIGATCLSIIIFISIFSLLRNQIKRRIKNEEELQESKEWFFKNVV